MSLYKLYKNQQKFNNGHIEINFYQVYNLVFLFFFKITLSIIVFLGALSNAKVSLLPLFPKAETLIMLNMKSSLYIENAFHININNIIFALSH